MQYFNANNFIKMNDFSSRLSYLIENQLHMSVREFEIKNKFPLSTIQRAINGTNIGLDKVQTIGENYPDLNMDWLINGEGEIFNTKSTDNIDLVHSFKEIANNITKMVDNERDLIQIQLELVKSHTTLINTNNSQQNLIENFLKAKPYKELESRLNIAAEP
jgi:hypothetical protein